MVNKASPTPDCHLRKPERLRPEHDLSAFHCGQETLDKWLHEKALHNDRMDASRTYVACSGNRVVAYYCLSTGSVNRSEATGALRRNMPDPLPAMILGRLAVDSEWQAQGIGAALLQDALLRTVQVADIAGVKVLLVHALNDQAAAFYNKWGFQPSPVNSHTLFLSIRQAKTILSARGL